MDLSTIGNFLNNNSQTIGSVLGTGAQLYGQQNSGQAISSAANAGIGTANTTMGNINSLYQPQTTLGNGAMTALGSSLGTSGQPANPSNFLNMPGYQFAVDQGTQAIQRQASSMGSAYTPNTAQAVGQYVTGTAMQDYNTYISQLQNASQLGATANQNLGNANLQTAGNIEQLGMNSGMAQAGMYTGMGQTAAGAISGTNGSGVGGGSSSGGTSGVVNSLIGKGVNYLGGLLGGGMPAATGALGTDAFASGATANSALADAGFGNIGSAAGASAGAGLAATGALGTDAFASGAAANGALSAAGFGGTAASAAGTGAGAAAGGAAGGGAATGAGLGAAAGGAAALGGVLLPLALAAIIPTGENAQWWQGMTDQIDNSNPDTSTQGKLTLANDLLNHPGDDPYTQSQLQAWGIPQMMQQISQPITTVSPDGKGWLGGGYTGASRA